MRADIRSAYSSSTSILGLGLSITTLLIGIALIETKGTPPKLSYYDAVYVSLACIVITGFLYLIVVKQSWNVAYAASKITENITHFRNQGYTNIGEPRRIFAPSTVLNLFFILLSGIILITTILWLQSFGAGYDIVINVVVSMSFLGGIPIFYIIHRKFIEAVTSTLEREF